jgi:hypothetical protein
MSVDEGSTSTRRSPEPRPQRHDDAVLRRSRGWQGLAVAPEPNACRESARRQEELEPAASGRAVAQAERARGIVERVLEHGARDGAGVGARECARPLDALATVGALAVIESPVSRADLLPEPERRVRAEAVLEVELRGDPAVCHRRRGVDAVFADQERGAPRRSLPAARSIDGASTAGSPLEMSVASKTPVEMWGRVHCAGNGEGCRGRAAPGWSGYGWCRARRRSDGADRCSGWRSRSGRGSRRAVPACCPRRGRTARS